MTKTQAVPRSQFILSMCIFGTIGILRRWIPLSSGLVALVRGVIGALFLVLVVAVSRRKFQWNMVRSHFPLLALSGAAIGFNWILLFEAYNHTTVAAATLCYYLAPILVILAAPFVLKEALTLRRGFCALAALMGMVLVSGVTETGLSGLSGIALGLGAAVLYACVILMNQRLSGVPAYEKTIFQLGTAALALLPYVLLTEDWGQVHISATVAILLLTAGVLHTGVAYWLYFGAMDGLNANTVALLSYLDPILAIILSMLVLGEPMGIPAAVGAVLILGAAYLSEKN